MSETGYIPTIRIKDAWLIRQNASEHLHELWAKDEEKLADDKDMERIVSAYRGEWSRYEKQTLDSMCSILDMKFRKNVVDVYVAPWFSAFSDPLVMGVTYEPDRFVDVLTHELLHVLLTDNNIIQIDESEERKLEWEELFGEKHSFTTLVHIPVHAMHKKLILEIFKSDERIQRDYEKCIESNSTDYIKAWDYVNEVGHEKIIEQLKDSYANLKS